MSDKDPTQAIIDAMHDLTRILWSAAALLAPWLVPIGSAILFGWAMFQAALALGVSPTLAMLVGVFTAAGLETTNIGAAHAAVQLSHDYKRHPGRFALACLLIVFYVVLGIRAVYVLPVAAETRAIGGALFLLTPVAIIAQALTLDLGRARSEAAARDARLAERQAREDVERQRRWEGEKAARELRVLELTTQVKLANAEVRRARASTVLALPALPAIEPLLVHYECPQCNRSFSTVQALNAHKRFCVSSISVGSNGKG